MNKLLPLILISSLSLLATSCGSFFSSSILKQEIEAKIEYENSPSMTIRIMSDDGITSPSGDLIQKATDRIPVSFVPYTGLQFIKWQIINRENGNAYTDKDAAEIIDFENPNLTDTSFKIKRWAKDLLIKPLVAEKPTVLTNIPFYKPSGDFINTTIKIIFDSNMDDGSIYYTGEELKSLGVGLDKILHDALRNPDSIDSITKENRVYGYIGDDGERHFKNISIIYKRTGENLLAHFKAPFFIAPDTLLIPVDKENPPMDNSTITVSIKNFYYVSNGSKIVMDTEFKWGYVVNSHMDEKTPGASNLGVKNSASSSSNASPRYNWEIANSESALNLPEKKIWAKGSVTEPAEESREVTLKTGAYTIEFIPTRAGSGVEQYIKIELLNPETREVKYSRLYYYLGMQNVKKTVSAYEGNFEYYYSKSTLGDDENSFRVFDFSDCEPGTYMLAFCLSDCANNVSKQFIKINIGG